MDLMPRANYSSSSPYYATQQTNWYLDMWEPIDLSPDSTDMYVEVETKYEGRPDLLAYDLYGTSNYWWVFMKRNRDVINHPILDMKAGLKIWAPKKERLTKTY
jgi:hypothetical protein